MIPHPKTLAKLIEGLEEQGQFRKTKHADNRTIVYRCHKCDTLAVMKGGKLVCPQCEGVEVL